MDLILREYLSRYPNTTVKQDEPMSNHTSFKIGGPVRAMIFPQSVEETAYIIRLAQESGIRALVIGNGTNLLVNDRPMDMLVIKTNDGLSDIRIDGDTITAGSGILLSKLAVFALNHSLTGFEFAHGIPGTLGGAVVMNGGAYGGEIKNVVLSTTALCSDLEIREFTDDENDFSYRHSRYTGTGDMVLSAKIKLSIGNPNEIRGIMDELSARRKASQPLNMPSAGSFFKRPVGGFAGTMIEQAGLKGFAVGGAQVSEKHAGFIINRGSASFDDVLRLMEHVQNTVYDRFGIMLEPEVKIIK